MGRTAGHGRRGTTVPSPRAPASAPARSVPGRGRSPARCALLAGLGLAVLVLSAAFPARAASQDSAERDVQLVYCLGPAHVDDLVASAVLLDLLTSNSTAREVGVRGSAGKPTVEQWAGQHRKDFARACTALMTAESDTPAPAEGKDDDGGWLVALWQGVLLSAAGALLTLLGQTSERVASERRELRRRLSTEETAFRVAARAYLQAYRTAPEAEHAPVHAAREALAATLSQVGGPAARRRAARRAAEELPLAGPLPATREGEVLGKEARAAEARRAQAAVDTVPASVADLRRAAGYWSLRGVRERYMSGATTGVAV